MSYDTIVEKAATSFYNKQNLPPNIARRTSTKYESMPLSELKERGIQNGRLDKIVPFLPKGAWIAGGFLRAVIAGEDTSDGDIDFFFNSEEAFNEMVERIKYPSSYGAEKAFGYYQMVEYGNIKKVRIIDCESLAAFRPNIQLVRLFWFESPEHVIDSFDFTVCQFITDGKTLWYNPKGLEDIKTRTIRHNRESDDAITVLNRILKYQAKGYKISPELFSIAEKNAINYLDSADFTMYLYNDKNETQTHNRKVSPMQRAWEYLESAPASSAIYKKRVKSPVAATAGSYVISGVSKVSSVSTNWSSS